MGSMEDTIGAVVDKSLEVVADRLQGDMRNQICVEMQEQSNMVQEQM